MKKFEVKGTYKQQNEEKKFTKIVNSEDNEKAKEKTLSLIGGKQKIPRRNIKIETIDEVK
jgi:ribosomal protein L20A (L18A)